MSASATYPRLVGHLRHVWRYPVKSMAAEHLDDAEVGWHGIGGDRRWAFVRADSQSSGFPWHTIRENAQLCLYQARLRDSARPDASTVEVCTPEGQRYAVTDPALANELGDGVRVMRLSRGLFDAMPLSLISTTTVGKLCEGSGVAPQPLRFRPNLLIEPTADRPFIEDEWVGSTLRIGQVVLRVDRRDPRCIIVNVDPATAKVTPAVLKCVGKLRHAHAGVYASVVQPGRIGIGDEVTLG